MLNLGQNQQILKPTTLKFLYEIAAIPFKTRGEYLARLLKRKNAYNQKNVKLLNLIYTHLAEDKMLEWNDENIRLSLELSKECYYYHKSVLLKGLRMLYFNWQEIEEKEFNNSTKYKDNISLQFAKADKMRQIGMRKESKILFFKIYYTLNKKQRKTKQDYFILFNSVRRLCTSYHRAKNYKKFIFYLKILEKYGKHVIKTLPKLKSYVMTTLYSQRAMKTKFFADKTTTAASSNEILKLALLESRHSKNNKEEGIILFNLANYYKAVKNFKQSLKYLELGVAAGQKTKAMDMYFAFKSGVVLLSYLTEKIKKEEAFKNLLGLISNLSYTDNSAVWQQTILFNIVQLANFLGNEEIFNKYVYEYTAREIIYNGLNPSLRILYFMKWTNYLSNVAEIKIEPDIKSGKQYLNVQKANEKYVRKLDNSVKELTINTNHIRDIFFKREFFLTMLLTDFWKGKKCSLEYSRHIYQQLEWVGKTRPELWNVNKALLESTYFGVNLMAESKTLSYESFLSKYEQKFKNYAKEVVEGNTVNRLGLYYTLSFMAEQSGYGELKQIAKDTFWKLEKKYPEIIKAVINEVMEKENQENELSSLNNFKAA